MAQQGNDILKQILGVCVQINKKLDKRGRGSDKGTGSMLGVFGKSEKAAKKGSNIINSIMGSLSQFVKLTPSSKKIDRTSKAIKGLFETVFWVADHGKKANKFINIIERMAKSLKSIEGISKGLGMFMLGLGGAFVLLAGGIVLAGKLLGTGGVLATLGVVTLIIATVTLMIYTLSKLNKRVDKGSKTAKKMGRAMMYLAGGVVAMALGVVAVGKILGFGGGKTAIIGVLGILGIIGVFAVAFSILGKFDELIDKGAAVAGVMALGMAALALGTFVLAKAAQAITGIGDGGDAVNRKGEKKGKFGQLMSEIGPGLGVIGILMVSSALLFAALGAFSVPIIAGAVTSMVMSGALILMAKSTEKVMNIASGLKTNKIRGTITEMVTGTMGGLLDGVSQTLSEGDPGIKGFAKGIKNTAILMTGIGLLMSVSVALSMFAKAITAFATLDNMKVIESYDEKTGEPKFGATVNIKGVGNTVKETLVSFLGGLLGATVGLSKRKAKEIKKMGRALTGRRGMLSAVIQFADVLKTFAQFGPEGKIGYVDMVPDGTDEDGNAKFKQVPKTVLITEVTQSILDSISLFTQGIVSGVEGISNRDKRKLLNMSEALIGKERGKLSLRSDKPGLLEPINAFSKTLALYAKFGADGSVPVLDDEGNPTGASTPITDIVRNIVTAISSFSSELTKQLGEPGESVKDAEKRMKGYTGLIDQIATLGTATEGLDKSAESIMALATSMGSLAESINKVELEKLTAIGEIAKSRNTIGGALALAVSSRKKDREERKTEKEETVATPEAAAGTEKDDKSNEELIKLIKTLNKSLDDLPSRVGMAASSSLNDKQFTFEFQGDNKGVLNVG